MIGLIASEVVRDEVLQKAGSVPVARASFEFACTSWKKSIRVSLFEELADVVEHQVVGTTIRLVRLRVRPYGDGWTGYVGQGGAVKVVEENSDDWIDAVPREGVLLVLCVFFLSLSLVAAECCRRHSRPCCRRHSCPCRLRRRRRLHHALLHRRVSPVLCYRLDLVVALILFIFCVLFGIV